MWWYLCAFGLIRSQLDQGLEGILLSVLREPMRPPRIAAIAADTTEGPEPVQYVEKYDRNGLFLTIVPVIANPGWGTSVNGNALVMRPQTCPENRATLLGSNPAHRSIGSTQTVFQRWLTILGSKAPQALEYRIDQASHSGPMRIHCQSDGKSPCKMRATETVEHCFSNCRKRRRISLV